MLKDPWLKTLILLLVAIAAFYLTSLIWQLAVQFADILLLLTLAWVLAFALEPVTLFLGERLRIPRGIAVATVYIGLLAVLSILTVLVVPVIAIQISQIGTSLPVYLARIGYWLADLQVWLQGKGIMVNAAALMDYGEAVKRVESMGPSIVNNALALATGIASLLFNLVILFMLSFYIMLDGDRFAAVCMRALPADRQDDARYLMYSIHRSFGGYIRGQLMQALIYGVGTAATMVAFDLNYAAVASTLAMALMLIPFIGPTLAMLPPLLIAVFLHLDRAVWVGALLLILQQVVLNILAPRLMSKSIGMHPLLVLVAMLVGARLAGGWGAIFAIPIAGVIVAMVRFYRMTVDERKVHMEERAEEVGMKVVAVPSVDPQSAAGTSPTGS